MSFGICTSMRLTEAHNAATAAKPIPARAKMSSAVLNCIRFIFKEKKIINMSLVSLHSYYII